MKIFFLIPILSMLTLVAAAQKTDNTIPAKNDSAKWIAVDVEPEFPGGIEKLYQYITKNIKKRDDNGKVRVSFIVEKDGSLTNITIVQSLSDSADKECIRVMSNCPKWTPGMAGGKPARVKYTIPIDFN
jgi:protein TonB